MGEAIPELNATNRLFLCLFLSSLLIASAAESIGFASSVCPTSLGLEREKLTHLHFYFHDIITGRDPTAVIVVDAPKSNNSSTAFGTVVVMDDPLTEGPELSSRPVGRAQGIYASASQSEFGLLMVFTFAFTEGEYKGSSLSVVGREPIVAAMREMPIVGGSGLFRFARGYAQTRTHKLDHETKNAVMECNVYVFHY